MTTALPSHTTEEVRALLEPPGSSLLHELGHGLGGPYHVLFPRRFDANAAAFRAAFASAGVDGRVYYAKKANKASVFVERAAVAGLGVDVASHGELREALAAGVRGTDLVITGPAKDDHLLRVSVLHGALIAVDALDELDRVLALARELGRTAQVLLRLLPPGQPHSRFGLDDTETATALGRCRSEHVDMAGFSFHLSGYDIQERADLAARSVRLCAHARTLGLRADRVSVGGGFAVDYVGADDWRRFHESTRPEHFHRHKTFSGYYPYHSPVAGADALAALLASTPADETSSLADLVRQAGVTLLVEPGRALLDQCGLTLARVLDVRRAGADSGDLLVRLGMNAGDVSLEEHGVLVDPVLVPRPGAHADADEGPVGVYLAGNLCLEADLITRRKVHLPRPPSVGDLLAFANTAGYAMDFHAHRAQRQPLARTVAVTRERDSWRWRLDEEYWPITEAGGPVS
ncbi:alanine racemase [Streptomyces torulosus]|uniref:alanine racemase n=1 Tax=Streptomyces torulosus TaxID=68276 RepID=UPI0007C7A051|nr:alanine racemase [Streptomyces torulosus]